MQDIISNAAEALFNGVFLYQLNEQMPGQLGSAASETYQAMGGISQAMLHITITWELLKRSGSGLTPGWLSQTLWRRAPGINTF